MKGWIITCRDTITTDDVSFADLCEGTRNDIDKGDRII